MKRISSVLSVALMLTGLAFVSSCSKDSGSGRIADAVSLNMMDELNGKTMLGASNIYINKANNFYTSSNLISDRGRAAGLGGEMAPMLNNLVGETAVTPGHVYHFFSFNSIREFPSGKRAIAVDESYYQAYVASQITTEKGSVGAVVIYASILPPKNGLPEYEYKLGEISDFEESVEMNLPKGAECYWESDLNKLFEITTNNGKLKMELIEPIYNEILGNYPVFIRSGEVYTAVVVKLVRN